MRPEEIEMLVPAVIRQTSYPGSLLRSLFEAMAGFLDPADQILDDIDRWLDPRRTPDQFAPFLARLVDMDIPLTTGGGRSRELAATAVELSAWRGTARGLRSFLVTATGERAIAIDEDPMDESGRPRPFHIRVRAPEHLEKHRASIEYIIEREKPAYVTYDLDFEAPEVSNDDTGGT